MRLFADTPVQERHLHKGNAEPISLANAALWAAFVGSVSIRSLRLTDLHRILGAFHRIRSK